MKIAPASVEFAVNGIGDDTEIRGSLLKCWKDVMLRDAV